MTKNEFICGNIKIGIRRMMVDAEHGGNFAQFNLKNQPRRR